MTDMTPQQIHAVDQWLAGLQSAVDAPLEMIRAKVIDTPDPSKACVEAARSVAAALHADPQYRDRVAMSYISLLIALYRERQK